MLRETRPRLSPDDARAICRELYALDTALVRELPSERDQNFFVREENGAEHVLKIANANERAAILELQNEALAHIARSDPTLPIPKIRSAAEGRLIPTYRDTKGASFFCRLFGFLPGKPLADTKPHSEALLRAIGSFLGRLDRALEGFRHDAQSRPLQWKMTNAPEILSEGAALVDSAAKRTTLDRARRLYDEHVVPRLGELPAGVIHGDANDHNLLVSGGETVAGILDFGDMVESPLVCEIAVAAAYTMLEKPEPLPVAARLIAGYHEIRPLSAPELETLFALIATRLAMSVSISARQFRNEPEQEYLRVSEAGAWRLLNELFDVCPRAAHYRFREACGLEPHPRGRERREAIARLEKGRILPFDLAVEPIHVLDLSIGSTELGGLDVLDEVERFTEHVFSKMKASSARIGIGRYDEARPLYRSDAFHQGSEPRTIHLGIDLFVEEGTEVVAPLDGVVHSFRDNDAPLDYGPTVLLEHPLDGGTFWTLYGHLSRASLSRLERGRKIARGEVLAHVGNYPVNGNWPPHLHFQIILDLLDHEGDFPGVAPPSERDLWLGLCPDPSRFIDIPESRGPRAPRSRVERSKRKEHLSGALSLSYERPLHIVRGYGSFLYDDEARPYLDMVNNVCHVGHCHPRVVRAAREQIAVLNTNTRYLHENILEYAERLTATLPESLEVCFFVNSGSEANDLALRLACAHTGRRGTLVLGGAYHGNLTSLIEISPYKFDGPGGSGAPPHVVQLDMPDGYRGVFRSSDPDYCRHYLDRAREALQHMAAEGRPVGAFIAEAILSCGGQIVLPQHYLEQMYRLVREAGGVTIADEVQVGFGRVGSHFWAFEAEDAVPDIVTMGKPIGNGHPLGAVVTTRAVAESFETGMEYFNTFGGNPVSCAVGLAVLDVVRGEGLQENAGRMGDVVLRGLRELQDRHAILGDVRGRGLFLGFELVKDRASLEPAAEEADYLVNRMREAGVLTSTDGPLENVIKLKPPLVFSPGLADRFLDALAGVLQEDPLQV